MRRRSGRASRVNCGRGDSDGRCAAALGRGSFVARPAAERRAIARPAVAVAHRCALGQGRADAARRRTGRARAALRRQAAHPRLIRPLVRWFGALIVRRLSHAAPPRKASANSPCNPASSTSTYVRPMCTNSHTLSSSLPGFVEVEIILSPHQCEQLFADGLLLIGQIAAQVLHLAHQGAAFSAVVGRNWYTEAARPVEKVATAAQCRNRRASSRRRRRPIRAPARAACRQPADARRVSVRR